MVRTIGIKASGVQNGTHFADPDTLRRSSPNMPTRGKYDGAKTKSEAIRMIISDKAKENNGEMPAVKDVQSVFRETTHAAPNPNTDRVLISAVMKGVRESPLGLSALGVEFAKADTDAGRRANEALPMSELKLLKRLVRLHGSAAVKDAADLFS